MARTANIENEELKTTEIDMTEAEADEALKADMAANEVDYLAGLLNAAEDAEDETKKIEIVRNGKTYFAFSIHSLPDETLYEIRKKYTKYVKNKRTGTKVAEGVDNAKLRSSMIYNATVAEDQEKLWDNKQVHKALSQRGKHIINALDVIDAVLLPGEKENILSVLDELSGYDSEEAKVETAKKLIRFGYKSALLHWIFQRQGIRPDEVMALPVGVRAFLFASTEVWIEENIKKNEKR